MRHAIAIGCSFLAVMAFAAPAEARSRSCSNAPGADVIGTTGVTCRAAHRVVRVWLRGVRLDDRYNQTVLGFRCRNRPSRYEGDTMVCVKGPRRIVWYVNMPR